MTASLPAACSTPPTYILYVYKRPKLSSILMSNLSNMTNSRLLDCVHNQPKSLTPRSLTPDKLTFGQQIASGSEYCNHFERTIFISSWVNMTEQRMPHLPYLASLEMEGRNILLQILNPNLYLPFRIILHFIMSILRFFFSPKTKNQNEDTIKHSGS